MLAMLASLVCNAASRNTKSAHQPAIPTRPRRFAAALR